MDELTKILAVCEGFQIPGRFVGYERMRAGHLHHTYRIRFEEENGKTAVYTAQEINTYAFRKPIEVMENIELVTTRIAEKNPGRETLRFLHARTGEPYLIQENGEGSGFWRAYNYIDAVTFNESSDLPLVRSTGAAFGEFMMNLADVDPLKLHYTIPDFHDTRKRYEQLDTALARNLSGRAHLVKPELEYLMRVRDEACVLTDLCNKGQLPIRVTHNDTKINNVLFDGNTHEALAVIDLDTVMPGLVGHDFGDAIRFVANTATEDCIDLDKVHMNLQVAQAYAEGFLEKTAGVLTEMERNTIARSPFVLTVELATRFLADYLDGDQYFHVDHPEHNLQRTRCQIALSKDIDSQQAALDAAVQALVKKYL